MNGNDFSAMIANQEGAAQGLWTHTPVDWAGNEGQTKPDDWPAHAADGTYGPDGGTRPTEPPSEVVIDGGLVLEIGDVAVGVALTVATVTWTTNVPSGSLVRFGDEVPLTRSSAPDATQVSNHVVSLDGLLPGATYHYAVSSWTNTQDASISGSFDVPQVAHHDP